MASSYSMQKRNLKWYQEDSEQTLSGNRMQEAYDPSRLKAGSDGKKVDSVLKGYAKDSDRKFDDLGASAGKKTGKTVKVEAKKPVKKTFTEEFDEEPFEDDLEGGDIGAEAGSMEDMDMGAEAGMDAGLEGGDDIVEDSTIIIGGKTYTLTPVPETMGDETVEGGDELGDEALGGDELGGDMDIGAEEEDVPKFEGKNRKAVAEKLLAEKKALEKKLALAEQKLVELFTGSYVASDSGEKPTRAGDPNFAVTAKANSGKAYTPTVNPKGAFEPKEEDLSSPKSKSPDNQTVKTSEAKKAEFKKWLAEQDKRVTEAEDAGQTSEDFNKNDTEDNFIGDEFADAPLDGDEDQIYTEKTSRGSKALKESFDFKKLMKGNYK